MSAPAQARPKPVEPPGSSAQVKASSEKAATTMVAPKKRDAVLAKDWRSSEDVAWTTSGDATGFHVLTAPARSGYAWRTVATLSEPGVPTDRWIGNACVTGSGRRMVVVYAPRTYTNEQMLAERGAFTAVVDLVTGEVTKVPVRTSLAYFNPSCGAGETVVLTQEGHAELGKTRLIEVDAVTGELDPVITSGQVTSPVPTSKGVIAARGARLVRIEASGEQTRLTTASTTPFRVHTDAGGGVVFMERDPESKRIRVRRLHRGRTRTLATGELGKVRVTAGKGGEVFITGTAATPAAALPPHVRKLDVPVGTQPSTLGQVAIKVELKRNQGSKGPRRPRQQRAESLSIQAKVTATEAELDFTVTPNTHVDEREGQGNVPHPKLASPTSSDGPSTRAVGSPTNPVEAERTCSVPRNDPNTQVYQPTLRQVEWAVNQAVQHNLHPPRPDDWKGSGLQAWDPQTMFPPIPLEGGGRIPAQIMLGVLTQESNMSQASWHALPGVTGNPLVGNYYGRNVYDSDESNNWDVNFAEADCGYGMSQVTDHMRLAGHAKEGMTPWPMRKQRAVALDYATNLAAGMQILQKKWNKTRRAGMIINNGDASKIENWFYALWAYNSGFYPKGEHPSGQWGVGWFNNPINPRYPADRDPFLETTYHDAAHPQDWPYQEKVIGWAGHPLANSEGAGYRAAWWNSKQYRAAAKPPIWAFCDSSNSCNPASLENPCKRADYRCWYHKPVTWKKECELTCGNEFIRFNTTYPEQPDGTNYPPVCDLRGLPSNALIIDDVPDSVDSVRPNCGHPWKNAGKFTLRFASDDTGRYPSKVDFHQIGAGFGGHFWFAHTRKPGAMGGKMEVTGTWTLDRTYTGPMKIMAALPDHGAHTHLANYQVNATRGPGRQVVQQPGKGVRWVSIGTYMFDGVVPQVTLSSVTPDGTGEEDIAFDAMAFIPIDGQYHQQSVEAVALFDEDQNIDTAAPESWVNFSPLEGRQALYDWAMSTSKEILSMPVCNSQVGDCLLPNIQQAVQKWRNTVKAAGVDPVNHPDGNSIATWIGFANSYKDRPSTDRRPDSFNDDSRYKIRTKAVVSFVTDESGQVIPGSEYANYSHRTADTHIPEFVLNLFKAVAKDYSFAGVQLPYMGYRARDLNVHNGAWTTVRPLRKGIVPGRAYAYAGKAPELTNYAGEVTTKGADCVAALTTAGGSIGYRTLLSKSGPTDAMYDFSNKLDDTPEVAQPVADLVEDIREMFFDAGFAPVVESSMFNVAPPIWQELNFRVCADGSVRPVSGQPILRASWMPDQYLYHNGKAIDQLGNYTESNDPTMKGNFYNFSHTRAHLKTPYLECDMASGRSGNPWDITELPKPGYNPTEVHFCLDPALPPDPTHSSP